MAAKSCLSKYPKLALNFSKCISGTTCHLVLEPHLWFWNHIFPESARDRSLISMVISLPLIGLMQIPVTLVEAAPWPAMLGQAGICGDAPDTWDSGSIVRTFYFRNTKKPPVFALRRMYPPWAFFSYN
jgi:hypothetical protein